MAQTYSPEAQIHSLSLFSNAAYDLQEPSFSSLQSLTTTIVTDALNDAVIQSCIGNWSLIWGPVVFSNDPDAAAVVADNTMMLAVNEDKTQFVVAIAGTNAVSMYGWFQEDFGVNTQVEWETVVNKSVNKFLFTPCISGGTNTGLQRLLAMESSNVTMLQALDNYLQEQNITGASIAVAGHSLGGALAPVMAMYMQDTQSAWNKASNSVSSITAWPTAGPTPGNNDFATYVQDNMGSNYTSRYNTIDVVPQAWMYSSFENIPSIYPDIAAPESAAPYYTGIGLLVTAANLRAVDKSDFYKRINYQQIQPWNSMTGTFDADTDKKARAEADILGIYASGNLAQYKPYFKAVYQFLMQMVYQHTTAYYDLLGITAVADEFTKVKNKDTGTTVELRRQQAVSAALGRYFGVKGLNIAAIMAAQEAAPAI